MREKKKKRFHDYFMKSGSVKKFVFLVKNGSFLVRIQI